MMATARCVRTANYRPRSLGESCLRGPSWRVKPFTISPSSERHTTYGSRRGRQGGFVDGMRSVDPADRVHALEGRGREVQPCVAR